VAALHRFADDQLWCQPYLNRLPLDQLKIDLSFVRDILMDAWGGAVAQSVISLSKAMEFSAITKEVES
jgi:EAL domain-containing protein (putative c-di-GMP-specific phosphodiesterase class I)